ncbi:signal transducer and activator of transcription 1-alpha/beta-like [Mastacembelus armatus]|uniref:Signal transducer and activator of transcription n=1 Tax=Mastacembelus armatus TaxID=205130 RepID=A0A3Q3LN71_9TELE|nr:signal transducer and activator of transcription 1-alpha/beta-like [Mastacembelus armatus]XP_026151590.1 signal transducer and activator of transcription 1-alpha/beta-like [Mastacembelus armatus]
MAQWQELLRLNLLQGQLSQLYEKKFPRHIRHSLCFWIESQDWDLAAEDENKAAMCFCALLAYLEEQWNRSIQENNVFSGPDFPGMQDYLVKHFNYEPRNLAIILSECLSEEKRVLASALEKQGSGRPAVEQTWAEMDYKINDLKRQILEVKKKVKSLEVLNENLDYIQKTWPSKAVEHHIGLAHSHAAAEKEYLKQMVLEHIGKILKEAEQIVAVLTDVELPEWKHKQQMACIGSPAKTCLSHLQKWFSAVAELLLHVRQQLQKLQDLIKKYNSAQTSSLPDIIEFAAFLFIKLLTNALVVEKQPVMLSLPQRPLILKTGVRFTATVRFLANLPEFKNLLKVKPVFDKDVEEARTVNGFRHFDFNRDNSKVLDVDTPNGGLVAEFGHMSLKEIKGRSKGSCESVLVTEELHIIKFVTVFQYAGLECNIEVSSLPMVVLSSTNQISSAWASVMWCNMLSTSEPRNLALFADPPPLTWQQLSQALSWQFLSVGQRELDENQLSMLKDKIVDDPDGLVHWSKFSKNESSWMWIDGILDLIKKYLVDLWRDGHIMGFVSRERTRVLLQEKQSGTFLLRFSESSKDGAITFSWVEHSNGETHVHAVEPYTKKELMALCLPDIIYLYSLRAQGQETRNPLLYLYPNIPKDTAFGRYYNIPAMLAPKKDVSGYINRRLVPISIHPTPPSSPPREMNMDIDLDTCVEPDQLIQDLFSDLLTLPGFPALWPSYPNTQTDQAIFDDPRSS